MQIGQIISKTQEKVIKLFKLILKDLHKNIFKSLGQNLKK